MNAPTDANAFPPSVLINPETGEVFKAITRSKGALKDIFNPTEEEIREAAKNAEQPREGVLNVYRLTRSIKVQVQIRPFLPWRKPRTYWKSMPRTEVPSGFENAWEFLATLDLSNEGLKIGNFELKNNWWYVLDS